MKKWLLAAVKNLKEEERRSLEEQLREPCLEWEDDARQLREVSFSPFYFSKKEQLQEFLEKIENPKENAILLSDDTAWLEEAKQSQIARIGYQPCGAQEFLSGCDLVVECMKGIEPELLNRTIQRECGIPWMVLQTERLIVREFAMSDLDALFALYAGKGMTEFIEPLYPYEQEKEYQQAYIENVYRYFGYGMWLVLEKKSGRLIGRAGIEPRAERGGELELGYAIGRSYQRKGYATEVCRAICGYCKEYLGMEELFCAIEPENEASLALSKKLGFVFEKECENSGKRMCIMRCIL